MPSRCAEHLQFAMAVRDADRADVVALGEQQFENHLAVSLSALGESVVTSIPSSTRVTHAGSSLF